LPQHETHTRSFWTARANADVRFATELMQITQDEDWVHTVVRERTTGTVVGGVLGALVGREVERNSDVRCR